MKHPAELFIRYLLVRDQGTPDEGVKKSLEDWGILLPLPDESTAYFAWLRHDLGTPPPGFDPANRLHRPSVQYLREKEVYELFFPTDAVEEAWNILANPQMRLMVESLLMARMGETINKEAIQKLNRRNQWHLTQKGVEAYGQFFWNANLLTFDEWGRFLYGRTALYDSHMGLLRADKSLAFYHLRLDQAVESKKMIQRAQEIAYFTLEEVANVPGTRPDKVKAIGVLTKAVVECHDALSTSDMALKEVLSQFERFRMENPQLPPPSIHQIAPGGTYSGSGFKEKEAKGA